MKRKSLYTLLVLFIAVISKGQPLRVVTYETKIETAEMAAEQGDYYGAIEWFGKAYEESKDLNLQLAIADLYALLREYSKAEKIYERLLKRDKEKYYEDIRIDYGRVLKAQGKYKEAIREFELVRGLPDATDSMLSVVDFEMKGIELLDNLAPNLEAVISFLPGKVNTPSSESSPILGPDGSLYFSSFNRKKEIIMDGSDKEFHAKLFTAEKNDKGEYEKVTPLPESINRPDFNSGGVAFSRDGRRMYFTRAILQNNKVERSLILVSYKGAEGWGAPREIENLNGEYVIKHPIVGELFGNEVLFFSSNMPGGTGGFDLYYSTIKGDNYGLPTNLGTTINTVKDEITPFYSNGTLYFSSNGHPTIGGFDIFYANWNGSNFEKLTNIGYNYNSSFDDMFLRFNESGSQGFLVSNRTNKDKPKIKGSDTCCDDIYAVFIRDLVIDLLVEIEDEKGEKLSGSNSELYDLSLGGYPETKTNMNGNTFNYPLQADRNYKAYFKKEGYFPDSISFNTNGILDDYTVKKVVKLRKDPNYDKNKDKGKVEETITVSRNEPIRLNNIYFDFNKWDILPESEDDLEVLYDLMTEYSDMVIELSSHTDSRGSDKSNESLSQKRAQSTKNWLTNRGIDPSRIKAVGYGEKRLVNQCDDNTKCSEAEHRLNRRSEFKIIAGPTSIEIKKDVFKDKGNDRSGEIKGGRQSFQTKVPIITFDKPVINLGKIKRGDKRQVVFDFVNTGDADLIIEIATTCKCTNIEWPKDPVKPGHRGVIKGIYNTENEKIGEVRKIIDIIANTDPIVVEAIFTGEIVE